MLSHTPRLTHSRIVPRPSSPCDLYKSRPALAATQAAVEQLARRAAAGAAAAICAASLVLAPAPALSDEAATVIRLPASEDPAILTAQQTMVQAWQIVGDSFYDGNFGGANWVGAGLRVLRGGNLSSCRLDLRALLQPCTAIHPPPHPPTPPL
jgi:hypothetical protein